MLEGAGLSFAMRNSAEVPQTNNPFVEAFEISRAGTQTIPRTERWQVPAPSGLGNMPAHDRQFASTYGGPTLEPGWNAPIKGRDAPAPPWSWPEFVEAKRVFEYETRFLGPSNQQEAVRMHRCYRTGPSPPRCDMIPQVVAIPGSNQINF